jgi:hypothetical protein
LHEIDQTHDISLNQIIRLANQLYLSTGEAQPPN